ncbi:Eco29kI family restriction endonuclease [Stenotrophomonas maltophilia]|nr:Eco29kI family restriction endonuclease [Stenotrophomonas maltophilia]
MDVNNIGVTLAVELLEQDICPLPPAKFPGAGVYAIYYSGPHPAYAGIVCRDGGEGGLRYPIYIGSAARENAKQGFNPSPTTEARIWNRLKNHAESIRSVVGCGEFDLREKDFHCRYLVLDDAYINLAESVLIAAFRPAWNGIGFGSKVVGKRRQEQVASLWDSLHPGRKGRPAGDLERRALALKQMAESVEKVNSSREDPRVARMVEKIRKFI